MAATLEVNGRAYNLSSAPDTPLLWVLRDELGLTGTKYGTCYGLSAAMFGAITLTDGKVDQGNFDSYRVLRNSEAPTVETYIVASANAPSGVGEPGTPVIGPAVANAILAITGKPVLSQPFVKA